MPRINEQELAEILKLNQQQIDQLTYEAAMQKLEIIVEALEQEGTPLELGLKLYQTGNALAKKCGLALDAAEEVMLQLRGTIENPSEAPFDPEKDGR
ncbi:MAG TPA: exodeoxyribonuclease VII small subunit [Candidatus Rifleibacterium sp.]|jgi:exodeoxyribonuclease VII small subunit|nr:exodeoxyribonuclease VII small subunit [Candidatus Rifleibacterium sp.]HOI90508.1 exodeoxyribonuclease VII small subunit [Candidatus Rifleibacterium sp.]HQB83592.1 exodeoxyribonuclease VII small subunit [Candidatus Rifleibacterium sp.]